MTFNELHEKLSDKEDFIDNDYLLKYIDLIISNQLVEKTKYTQCHHIIPRHWFKLHDLPIDNSQDNLINLSLRDHVLAHYYLTFCTINQCKIKNVQSVFMMINQSVKNIDEKTLLLKLPFMEELYKNYIDQQAIDCGNRFRGVKQREEVVENRTNKVRGQKRTEESRRKMSVWQKGIPKSEEARKNMSIAQKKYYASETDEHKRLRIEKWKETMSQKDEEWWEQRKKQLSESIRGRIPSEEERRHHSEALKGRNLSQDHRINLARSRSKYTYAYDGILFLSLKEVREYINNSESLELNVNQIQRLCGVNKEYWKNELKTKDIIIKELKHS